MKTLIELKTIANDYWTKWANAYLTDPTSQQTKELKKIYEYAEYAFNEAKKSMLYNPQKV